MERKELHFTLESQEIESLFREKTPVKLEQGGLYFCQSGEAEIVVDMKQFLIRKGDLIVVFPFSVVQLIRNSFDFYGYIIGVNVSFFSSFQIQDKASYYLYIKENPCISLTDAEYSKIYNLYNSLQKEDKSHPLRKEIDECLLKVIAYEIAAIYLSRKPIVQQPRTRNETIFHLFIFSLFNNFQKNRTLQFYSTQQSITPRHLSTVVKNVSGTTAGKWITNCVMMNLKLKLQDKTLSINQISDMYNFPNSSFFSQYFKKYEGITPREYRKTID